MINETDLDLQTVRGSSAGSGVTGGDAIAAYVDATLGGTDDDVSTTRSALISELGMEAVVDVAAVITMFSVMNRVADTTGTPIDEATRPFIEPVADLLGMHPQD